MQKYKVSVSGVLEANVDVIAGRFSKVFKIDSAKAKVLLTAGKPRALGANLDREKAQKIVLALRKMGLEGVVEPPFSETAEPAKAAEARALSERPLAPLSLEPIEGSLETAAPSEELTLVDIGEKSSKPDVATQEGLSDQELKLAAIREKTKKAEQAEQAEQIEAQLAASKADHLPEINRVPIGHGLQWLNAGFDLLKMSPITWIVSSLIAICLNAVLGVIPVVGFLISMLTWPILFAGLMLGAHNQANGEKFSAWSFTLGLDTKPGQLVLVGVIYMLAWAVILLVGAPVAGIGFALLRLEEPGVTGFIIFALICATPPLSVLIFAPTLVAIDGLSALEACKLSIEAGLKNILPFSFYLLGCTFLLVIGALLVGVGLLVALPIIMASMYAAYRDIYY